jgi:hypothetical protein
MGACDRMDVAALNTVEPSILDWETNRFLEGCAAHRSGLPVVRRPSVYECAFATQLAIVTGKRPAV